VCGSLALDGSAELGDPADQLGVGDDERGPRSLAELELADLLNETVPLRAEATRVGLYRLAESALRVLDSDEARLDVLTRPAPAEDALA
jgi:hypothetical protein